MLECGEAVARGRPPPPPQTLPLRGSEPQAEGRAAEERGEESDRLAAAGRERVCASRLVDGPEAGAGLEGGRWVGRWWTHRRLGGSGRQRKGGWTKTRWGSSAVGTAGGRWGGFRGCRGGGGVGEREVGRRPGLLGALFQ